MTRAWLHICAATLASAAALTLVIVLACAESQQAQPTTPAPAACAKDTDCKGERICIQGACVQPR